MSAKYILRDGVPVPAKDLEEWALWFGTADRCISRVEVGDKLISTVFLGLDHSYGDGPPLLFETMIFDKDGEELYCDRYSTLDDALAGHAAAVYRAVQG